MARKKCKCPAGVPEWVVTYGDMMSLLLTFFILLAAFSELKQEHEYQKVISAVKEAFGYSGGVGVLPVDDPPVRSMIESLTEIVHRKMNEMKVSKTNTEGLTGVEATVSRVHDGLMFTIGGNLAFAPGSAEILESARPELLKVAALLRGRNNKIEIRGHAASKPLTPESGFEDLWDLSYARAKSVMQFLVDEGGLRRQVLVVEARADNEPVAPRTYSPEAQTANRRVEIILTESLVDDLHPDPTYSNEDYARGG